ACDPGRVGGGGPRPTTARDLERAEGPPGDFLMAPTNSERRNPTTVVPPHPVLNEYYSRPDERQGFVADLFDGCARYYNRVGAMLDFGSGRWYRRDALRRAGLRKGMRLLDVAAGTRLMTRGGVAITGQGKGVGGGPSPGGL